MKTNHPATHNPNRRLFGLLLAAALVLSIPIALQLSIGSGVDGQGFNWKLDDFIIIGLLLLGTALLCEFVLRRVKNTKTRLLICGAILLAFLLIWADLAVGIFNIQGFSGS